MAISKDISLNVLASVQGYAKELGKILKRQPWKLLDRPDK